MDILDEIIASILKIFKRANDLNDAWDNIHMSKSLVKYNEVSPHSSNEEEDDYDLSSYEDYLGGINPNIVGII